MERSKEFAIAHILKINKKAGHFADAPNWPSLRCWTKHEERPYTSIWFWSILQITKRYYQKNQWSNKAM